MIHTHMTHIDDVRSVIDDSQPEQWKYFEKVSPQVSVTSDPETICYVYEEDVNIRLERGNVAVRHPF
ncbi:hypothetical protein BDK61_3481 [Haloarcula quadrata]|uniref:Uncharacterized protein n=1 Tax=Haloarcula quadrata TaxID=182779 RepID=A0A495RA20_9EURY|nr:hypothetical protein BDK61_3481 [Haloarcula quadrata]